MNATPSRPGASVRPAAPLAPALALAHALAVAACGGPQPTSSPASSGAPSTPGASEPTPVPVPTPVDGVPGGGGGDPGQGGGAVPIPPIEPGIDDGLDGPANPVEPVAGAVDVHDVAATGLRAVVDGRRVTAELRWWSGVEPCHVLAGVEVARDGSTFTLTIREGSLAGKDVACIEIAMLKSTLVDLGELDPGEYTIRAVGDAAPVEVVVAG